MQIRTGTARSGDLDIYYEDMGEPTDPAVLLIMGLGSQLLLWRDGFCEKLVAQGLRVIRYDNRDVGLSSKTERRGNSGATIPSMLKFWLGIPGRGDYGIRPIYVEDMAALLVDAERRIGSGHYPIGANLDRRALGDHEHADIIGDGTLCLRGGRGCSAKRGQR